MAARIGSAALIVSLAVSACGGESTTTIKTETEEANAGGDPRSGGGDPELAKPLLSASGTRELERFAEDAPGRVGIAVSPLGEGEPVLAGDALEGRAWSTMKVPLLVALIDRLGGSQELTAPEREDAEAALTRSDNDAALALFDRLQNLEGGLVPASRAIESALRQAGDDETTVNTEPSPEGYSTFGQTIWSAEASTLFFRALAGGCLLGEEDTDYVLSLMEDVVPDQRWGLGEAEHPGGASLAFKGGWGPEPPGGYLIRQGGVVDEGDAGYVLSVIAIPADRGVTSFEAGQELVTEAAAVVAENVNVTKRAALTCAA